MLFFLVGSLPSRVHEFSRGKSCSGELLLASHWQAAQVRLVIVVLATSLDSLILPIRCHSLDYACLKRSLHEVQKKEQMVGSSSFDGEAVIVNATIYLFRLSDQFQAYTSRTMPMYAVLCPAHRREEAVSPPA